MIRGIGTGSREERKTGGAGRGGGKDEAYAGSRSEGWGRCRRKGTKILSVLPRVSSALYIVHVTHDNDYHV